MSAAAAAPVALGLRANARQFALLVGVGALVGATVGLERSTLPLVASDDFGVASGAAALSFIAAFGAAKAVTNLAAGALAARVGRKRLLVAGWLVALPIPLVVWTAPAWEAIVAANLLLGVNQGLTWSMTVVMKIDLVGPRRRGLALGLNESAGYGGVALAAAAMGWAAAEVAPRDALAAGGALVAVAGLAASALLVRDTAGHVAEEERAHAGGAAPPRLAAAFAAGTLRDRALRSCSQAGLVNNLVDGVAWGIVPLHLAASGAGPAAIGLVAGVYPAVWAVGQLLTGAWSDRIGRKRPIVAGMLVQAVALVALARAGGDVTAAALAAALLGAGTALVYPTLIAAVSDAVAPAARAPAVGVYRFWRDAGYVAGAVLGGIAADAAGFDGALLVAAALAAASGVAAWVEMPAGLARAPGGDTLASGPGRGEERSMRVIDCDCGVTLQAANDDELAERVREHVGDSHPDMEMSDDELRGFVESKAYSAMDS